MKNVCGKCRCNPCECVENSAIEKLFNNKATNSEDWLKRPEFEIGTRSGILREEFRRVIEQIQLDAHNAAVRECAEMCDLDLSKSDIDEVQTTKQAILTLIKPTV